MDRLEYYWPAVRARNFVKIMGGKPTKYSENIEFLAKIASVESSKMGMLGPVKFAMQYFPYRQYRHYIDNQLTKIMGRDTYWDIAAHESRMDNLNKAALDAAPVDYAALFDAMSFEDKKKAYLLFKENA